MVSVRAVVMALLVAAPLSARAQGTEGYYKDIFMDGGKALSGYKKLHAADMMGLSYDVLATTDKAAQNAVMVTSKDDLNGALLFPDGGPRYRAIFVNGGGPAPHGASLGKDGRQRIKDFVGNGGAYTGSCAGAFIAMLHFSKTKYATEGAKETYLHLWPGIARTALTFDKAADLHFSKPYHPLVQKYPSLADGKVENLYHSGGCRLDTTYYPLPKGTELIGKNHAPKLPALHGYYNILAYKKDQKTGRLVLVCSHPEGYKAGERRDLMAAVLSYALDGVGAPMPAKGALKNGKAVKMQGPIQKVGDGQYHHWTVTLGRPVVNVTFKLDGLTAPADLYLKRGSRPTRKDHLRRSEASGTGPRQITLPSLAAGTWHLGVRGAHKVKNGAAYTLAASWSEAPPPARDAAPADSAPVDSAAPPAGDAPPPDQHPGVEQGCNLSGGPGHAWLTLIVLALLLRRWSRPAVNHARPGRPPA